MCPLIRRDQASYKTTGRVMVLYVIITALGIDGELKVSEKNIIKHSQYVMSYL
jgi:hypothetical protein